MNAQAPANDEAIQRMLSERQPQQELRLGQLQCFKDSRHPISVAMRDEMRSCRFDTFDRVMGALVRDGMNPLNAEDLGIFVSWLVINDPYKEPTIPEDTQPDEAVRLMRNSRFAMGNSHAMTCNKLACWNLASSCEADPETKVMVGTATRLFADDFNSDPRECLKAVFGSDTVVPAANIIGSASKSFRILTPEQEYQRHLTDEAYALATSYRVPPGQKNDTWWYVMPGTRMEQFDKNYRSYCDHQDDNMGKFLQLIQHEFGGCGDISSGDVLVGKRTLATLEAAREHTNIAPWKDTRSPDQIILAPRIEEIQERFTEPPASTILSECQQHESAGRFEDLSVGLISILELSHPKMKGKYFPTQPQADRVRRMIMLYEVEGNREASNPCQFALDNLNRKEFPNACDQLLQAVETISVKK